MALGVTITPHVVISWGVQYLEGCNCNTPFYSVYTIFVVFTNIHCLLHTTVHHNLNPCQNNIHSTTNKLLTTLTHTDTHKHVCRNTCTHTRARVCTHACTHTHSLSLTHTHTHTHTHTVSHNPLLAIYYLCDFYFLGYFDVSLSWIEMVACPSLHLPWKLDTVKLAHSAFLLGVVNCQPS